MHTGRERGGGGGGHGETGPTEHVRRSPWEDSPRFHRRRRPDRHLALPADPLFGRGHGGGPLLRNSSPPRRGSLGPSPPFRPSPATACHVSVDRRPFELNRFTHYRGVPTASVLESGRDGPTCRPGDRTGDDGGLHGRSRGPSKVGKYSERVVGTVDRAA